MVLVLLLVAAFATFLALGRTAVPPLRDWRICLRWGVALMFLLTGAAHWSRFRAGMVQMVPPYVPYPEFMVSFTGVAEIAGALGLLLPRLAPWAAAGLALLLVGVFPANVHSAVAHIAVGGYPPIPLVQRALMQLAFLAAVLLAGFAPRRWAHP